MVKVQEVRAKSVLNKSKIFDFCLNPYTGCELNCAYCYARLFMKRYSGHREAWGKFVDVKVNAPELLKRQLDKARRGIVWVSSVCDPYQPLEEKYEITRRCLAELLERQFPVNIQTKSTLVLRDLDLLRRFEEIEVGLTVTTDEERVARLFEPGAAPVGERIGVLEKLHASGIRTFAFIGPILPGDPERLVKRLESRVDRVFIDRMNYLNTMKRFYLTLGFKRETTEAFFEEQRERLIFELRKRGIAFTVLF